MAVTGQKFRQDPTHRVQRFYDASTFETTFVRAPIWGKQDFNVGLAASVTPLVTVLGSTPPTAALVAGARGGVYRLTTGGASGTYSADGIQLQHTLGMTPVNGLIGCEARFKMNTSVAKGSMGFGFTDTAALEEPFSISGTTITSNASDAANFTYDVAQTTDRWYTTSVKADTDGFDGTTGLLGASYLPVADTYDILRVEIDLNGTAYWFINGVLVQKKLLAVTVSSSVLFIPMLYVNASDANAVVVDVDYMAWWGTR